MIGIESNMAVSVENRFLMIWHFSFFLFFSRKETTRSSEWMRLEDVLSAVVCVCVVDFAKTELKTKKIVFLPDTVEKR